MRLRFHWSRVGVSGVHEQGTLPWKKDPVIHPNYDVSFWNDDNTDHCCSVLATMIQCCGFGCSGVECLWSIAKFLLCIDACQWLASRRTSLVQEDAVITFDPHDDPAPPPYRLEQNSPKG